MKFNPVLSLLAAIAVFQGCTYGTVYDADLDMPVDAALVAVLEGDCVGAGCGVSPASMATNVNGLFNFDAYHSTQQRFLQVSGGQEALEIRITKPGYQTVTVYHKPNYTEVQVNGQALSSTSVGRIYLCLLFALDSDGDSICDAAEARYGTDPLNSDTDGDNLSDAAELYGYQGVDLKFYGASPLHKDLLIEADYLPGLKPYDNAIQMVVDAFAAAPITNPDGVDGINLIIDVSDEIAPADVDTNLSPVWSDFDLIKNKYFPTRRGTLFHYALFVNQHNSGASSGISRGIPASDFVVSLGNWSTPGGTLQQQAGTLMHEFGHNIGIRHGGNENQNWKVNYFSVMNYLYQLGGLKRGGSAGVLDFSRLQVASVDESLLNESYGMAPVVDSGTTEGELSSYTVFSNRYGEHLGNAAGPLDWDADALVDTGYIAVDLDFDSFVGGIMAASQNDWDNLIYNGGGNIGDSHLGAAGILNTSNYTPAYAMDACMTESDQRQ